MVDGSVVLEVEGAGLCYVQASLPPAAAASKAATAHCIIVSYCQMMAMARTAFSLLLPAVKSQILLEIRGKKYENASGRKSK